MKFLSLTAAMSVAFVSFLPDACFGKPSVGAKYPEVSSTQLPSCYIETSDNRILDLTRMCVSSDKADESSSVTDGGNTSSSVIDGGNTRASNYSSSSPQTCDEQDDAAQNSCQEWAASKLPGVPYN